MTTEVILEIGAKKTFAGAVDWPGWCRAGKDPEAALAALGDALPRYAAVIARAGLSVPSDVFKVVEEVPGDATTDFGAPGRIAANDREEPTAAQRARIVALVEAVWAEFDAITADTPEELRKGPRGGGRDRTKMVAHVLGAEQSYARNLGVKLPVPAVDDPAAIAALRTAIRDVLSGDVLSGDVLSGDVLSGSATATRWPTRYAARRIAWHVLDHAWEMRDRSDQSGGSS